MGTPAIDLHTHSSASDGADTPGVLLMKAAQAGLSVIALCDHDTFAGLREAGSTATAIGLEVLPGVEISTRRRGVSVHLLGYGCRRDDLALNAGLAKVRSGRQDRVETMRTRLAELGMPIPADVLAAHVKDSPSVGRPHFADAMVELGYVSDRSEAFDRWLSDEGPAFVDRYCLPFEEALQLVHGAGGVAVVAHPWGRTSVSVLDADYLTSLVSDGLLDGIEVNHDDHDLATRKALASVAGRCGALVTGGSDYHGTGKKRGYELGCNTTSAEVLTEIQHRVTDAGGQLGV